MFFKSLKGNTMLRFSAMFIICIVLTSACSAQSGGSNRSLFEKETAPKKAANSDVEQATVAIRKTVSEIDFPQCIDALQQQAKERGLQENLISLLDDVNKVERVIQLDRNQPEFVQTFSGYFGRRVTDYRIQKGRELLAKHRPLLNQLTQEYGVPPQYLIAFWGLETNFGGYLGKIPTLDSLATLACDPRRKTFFTSELFTALELISQHDLDVSDMRGSWAGAMGHTQFMPSAYSQYAVDGDNDGRADLWNSIPDALTSAANFLKNLGWESQLRWGREVKLPNGFEYANLGLDQKFPLAHWRTLGVLDTAERPLADVDIEAALLAPSGQHGPQFLVYNNFKVIMRWNNSQFYALSVGRLADRINGAGKLHQPIPKTKALTKQQVEMMQSNLIDLGFDPGGIDGQLGPATSAAIRAFQQSQQQVADGFATVEIVNSLQSLAPENILQN